MAETYKATPVEFRPDGTIRLTAGGRAMRLRRPTLGEYRDLREQMWQMNDEVAEASEALRQRTASLGDEIAAVSGGDPDPLVAGLRDLNAALTAILVAASQDRPEDLLLEMQTRAMDFVSYLEDSTGAKATDVEISDDVDPAEKAGREAEMRRLTRESNRALREFTVTLDDVRLAFVRPMIDLLDVEGKPLEDGQVEQWMVDPQFIQKASEHLQSVPLDRGVS